MRVKGAGDHARIIRCKVIQFQTHFYDCCMVRQVFVTHSGCALYFCKELCSLGNFGMSPDLVTPECLSTQPDLFSPPALRNMRDFTH